MSFDEAMLRDSEDRAWFRRLVLACTISGAGGIAITIAIVKLVEAVL